MSRTVPRLVVFALLIGLTACGGGGGGGSRDGGGPTSTGFSLEGASFARPIFDFDGNYQSLVNPASIFETDPLTGVGLPGFPKPLTDDVVLGELAPISFPQILDPITPQIPVIPRNAAIALDFSKPVDPATLNVIQTDPDIPDKITSISTIQVRDKSGNVAVARALVDPNDPNRVILLGTTSQTLGWEASPLLFDPTGKVVEDPEGHLQIFIGVGLGVLRATDGSFLTHREDALASSVRPLPINPGNAQLDAIVLQTDTGQIRFNGFLPDLSPPRLVRPVELTGTLEDFDPFGLVVEDFDLVQLPNTLANEGLGEWANGVMIIQSAGGVESRYLVESNTNSGGVAEYHLGPGQTINAAVQIGDTYTLSRAEFYEPIPPPLPSDPVLLARATVEPDSHPRDPNDPQDLNNSDLRYFLRMFDENGVERTDVWNPATGLFLQVPGKTALRLRFSEPMDLASFRPYETFYVTDTTLEKTDPGFASMRLGLTESSVDGLEITFSPNLIDQADPDNPQFVGFGGTAASLRLVLRTLPEAADIQALEESATPAVQAMLQDLPTVGVSGITDLGGRGLGLPQALLDQSDSQNFFLIDDSAARSAFPPAADFAVEFATLGSEDTDYGVIVHRFQGQASSAVFSYPPGTIHDQVTAGVEYNDYPAEDADSDGDIDRRFIYGPRTVEVGLGLPGRLTGAAGTTIEHLIDDFNQPKPSSFASPNGEDFLVNAGFGTSVPLASPYGARFQHIYRAGDASPSWTEFRGVVLDLVGLAWAPDSNLVNFQTIENMELLIGVSNANRGRGPNTTQNNGIPQDGDSGLIRQFDCNLLEWTDNCCEPGVTAGLAGFLPDQHPQTTVVSKGTTYTLMNTNLFRPANASATPGTFNWYLPYPTFDRGLDPFFGKTNVNSYPYDSRFPMLVEFNTQQNEDHTNTPIVASNFYKFSPGILTSTLPRFRVWSVGQHPLAHCVPGYTTGGGTSYFRGGEGGPLVQPGCFPGNMDILPPEQNNGMPVIPATAYVLPPRTGEGACTTNQPAPNFKSGDVDPGSGCITVLPECNSNPDANWYFANGMLAYPLPNPPFTPLTFPPSFPAFPGPPITNFIGYGNPPIAYNCALPPDGGSQDINVVFNEPVYQPAPQRYGDNARYFQLWRYRKRVSFIESPTIRAGDDGDSVRYLRPIVEPPLTEVDPNAGLIVELKAGTLLNFSVPALDSGFISVDDPDFTDKVTGVGNDRVFVKFRASFGIAQGQTQPPSIDTVIIPYEKVNP